MSRTMAGYEGGRGGIWDVWFALVHSEEMVSIRPKRYEQVANG